MASSFCWRYRAIDLTLVCMKSDRFRCDPNRTTEYGCMVKASCSEQDHSIPALSSTHHPSCGLAHGGTFRHARPPPASSILLDGAGTAPMTARERPRRRFPPPPGNDASGYAPCGVGTISPRFDTRPQRWRRLVGSFRSWGQPQERWVKKRHPGIRWWEACHSGLKMDWTK